MCEIESADGITLKRDREYGPVEETVKLVELLAKNPLGIFIHNYKLVDPGCRGVCGLGLRPLVCWDRGFEPRWGHGYLSVV
jgi:hypothetical protein